MRTDAARIPVRTNGQFESRSVPPSQFIERCMFHHLLYEQGNIQKNIPGKARKLADYQSLIKAMVPAEHSIEYQYDPEDKTWKPESGGKILFNF